MIETWRFSVMSVTGPATESLTFSGCPAAMSDTLSAQIKNHSAILPPPRRRKVYYPLINIVTIPLCAVIAGADDFVTIAAWGRQKRAWLARFLDLSGGIPSHDRFNAVFKAINPAEFERCLLSWITSLHEVTAGQLVAIDGKTLRQSFDKADSKSAIHMVSAWATANHISLGQVVVDQKSNEITAIPRLLELLDVSGCLVTIDAMGCQAEIAGKIIEGKADYSLAGPVLPTIAEGDRGRSTLVIGVVRVTGRSDEDDPVDSPTAEGHQRATATRSGPADLPTALGGPLERSRSDPRGDRRPPGGLDPPGRAVAPHLPQQGAGGTHHLALPG